MALKEIPDRYLGMIIHFLMNFHNDTSEFNHPHIRKSFQSCYVFFIFLYGILILLGFSANIIMIAEIIKDRPHGISMFRYLAFNALNDVLKCVVILPLALTTTLFQNWMYGRFFCYFFPMLQDVPFHATMLTFLLITFDRYRQLLYPLKPRFNSFLCMISVWVTTIFTVLPYTIYTRYLDLELYFGPQFKGTGICAVNIDDNIEEYIRGLFIIMYVLPLGLIAFLHVKASEEIKMRQSACTVSFHDASASSTRENDSVASLSPSLLTQRGSTSKDESRKTSSTTLTVPKEYPIPRPSREEPCPREIALHFSSDDDMDWNLEKRIQGFLSVVIGTYAACLLPLNLVRLLKHVVYETYENSLHFDITFIIVVWIAFIPTVATPVIFHFWPLQSEQSTDISRYLRLGRASDVSFSSYEFQKKNSLVKHPVGNA